MEYIVNAFHGVFQGALVANVANVELDLVGYLRHTYLEIVTHVVLLLLIAAENADFTDISPQETVQHCVTKTTRATSNQQRLVFKY